MRLRKLLGTQPALITGAVQALLGLVVALGLGLTDQGAGVLMLVVSALTGAVAAWTTVDTRLTAIVEVVKAALLAVAFFQPGGLALSAEQQAAVIAAVSAIGSVFIFANNSPASTAVSLPTSSSYNAEELPDPAAFDETHFPTDGKTLGELEDAEVVDEPEAI